MYVFVYLLYYIVCINVKVYDPDWDWGRHSVVIGLLLPLHAE